MMDIELMASIVRILKHNGSTAGTGFVVSDEGLIATCAHVIETAGASSGSSVRIVFHTTSQEATASVESEGWRPPGAEDTAFLQLSAPLPEGVGSAILGTLATWQGAQIQAFGYPDLGEVEGLWGKGELIGSMTESRRPLLQLRSSEITAGFSGGPVWDVATGHVIGMVTQVATPDRYGKLGEVAFAIPAETLAALRTLKLAEAAPLALMRADYLTSLRQRFEYLDLGGITPRVQNRTVKLRMADVFVPLQARPEIESRPDLPDFMAEMPEGQEDTELALRVLARTERDAKPVDILELLHKSRVVVLGDPGCGKSTLLRHVAYAIATSDCEAVGETALDRLPIFVRIVQYSQAHAADPTLTLDRYVREMSEPKWALLFQQALDAGEALLLLDGLDEVIDAHQRKGIAEAIHTLAADYPGTQFLITSRIVGYQAARLAGDFVHFTVQPLPPDHITEFIEKWYMAIEREAGTSELSEKVRERAEELSETIQARPGIRRLAENPLLLTIIALVNWQGRKLPSRRVELYARAAETLIESWPYWRAGVRLETERVICLLSPVAYRIFATHSAGDITEDELLPVLADTICRVDGVSQCEAKIHAKDFLSQVSEHSGIFRERGFDERGRRVFGFLHLTFAEYFTARHLAGLWEGLGDDAEARRAFLRQYAHVPRWREVVLLMAGDVGLRDNDRAERATHLLSDILQLGSDYEEHLHRDLLLAGACLADDLRVLAKAAQYSIDRLLDLTREPGVREDVWSIFHSMRKTDYGIKVMRRLKDIVDKKAGRTRWNAACTLGAIGDDQIAATLAEFLDDEDSDIQSRTARILGQLGDTIALQRLLRLLKAENWRVRWNAAVALGDLGDDQASSALEDLLDDEDVSVRAAAIWALWKLGFWGEVDSLLKQLRDEEAQVRRRAARQLGMVQDGRVVDALLGQLQDQDMEVRAETALALGRVGGKRAVEPLLILLEDEDGAVRWAAAEAFGELKDPRAVESLSASLGDPSQWVRWGAAWALGQIGDARAAEPLMFLLHDQVDRVRTNAAFSLGLLGDSRALEPLLTWLQDKHTSTRGSAVRALGMLGDMRALEPLLGHLEDESWIVRGRAYFASVAILNRNAPEPEPEDAPCELQTVPGPWDA